MKRVIVLLGLLLGLAACAPKSTVPATQAAPPTTPPLTADEVMDAQVALTTLTNDVAIPYQLSDGVYQKGTDPAGAPNVNMTIRSGSG